MMAELANAAHESGHAAAAAALGYRVDSVDIIGDDEGRVGRCWYQRISYRDELDRLAVAAAGIEAELLIVPEIALQYSDSTLASILRGDLKNVSYTFAADANALPGWFRRGRRLARDILTPNLAILQTLSAELVKRREIRDDELRRFLASVWRFKIRERGGAIRA